jgi:hypothetical protein
MFKSKAPATETQRQITASAIYQTRYCTSLKIAKAVSKGNFDCGNYFCNPF